MFFIAPKDYSFSFCVACFLPFVYASYILFKYRCKYNIVCFELIFSITFFYVNYAYPIFLYPVMPYFSLFNLSFPENYLNSGIALSSLGYCCYVLGSLKYPSQRLLQKTSFMPCHPMLKIINIALLLLLLFQLLPILRSGVYNGDWGEGALIKTVVDALAFFVVFSALSKAKTVKDFIIQNKALLFCLFLYITTITLIGNRGMFLRFILLISLLVTTYFYKLPTLVILVSFIVGMLFLNYVGQVRGGGEYTSLSNQEMNPLLSMGKDLTINNRSLYSLMEYHDKNGINFGKTYLMNLLSAIPKANYVFLKITGWSSDDISSGGLITKQFYDANPQLDRIGLGTNLIGDIYIAFGVFGVILLMYYMGIFVSYSYARAQSGNMKYLLIYAIMFAESIIIARSSYLGIIRPMAWTLAFAYMSGYGRKVKK